MKKIVLYILCPLLFIACEDVIEVDTPAEAPRLIIDALIRVDTSEAFTTLEVKVSQTSSFFEPIPLTNLEQVTITNLDAPTTMGSNIQILIEEDPGSGVYQKVVGTDFLLDGELLLQVNHLDQRYLARTRFVPSTPITDLVQGDGTLFDGDETEIEITFMDLPDRTDYYVFDLDFDEFLVTEDTFYEGQEFKFSYFYDSDLQPGQEVNISLLGASEGFYNYMDQLIEQSGDNFGPFGTPTATVRGNIINVTDIDNDDVLDNVDDPNNFALGYFAVVQEFTDNIVVEER